MHIYYEVYYTPFLESQLNCYKCILALTNGSDRWGVDIQHDRQISVIG
jgi:hypothetical protein